MGNSKLALDDIQGIVLSGYGSLKWSAFSLLSIESPMELKRYLAEHMHEVTTAAKKNKDWRFNIAFTKTGLSKLGISDEAIKTFSRQFQEGMAHEQRSRVLGDINESDPLQWAWGSMTTQVDLLIMLYAIDEKTLEDQEKMFVGDAIATGLFSKVVDPIRSGPGPTTPAGFGREHFGFADGISQPVIEGSFTPNSEFSNKLEEIHGDYLPHATVAAGEFLHGYRNEYKQFPHAPIMKLSDEELSSKSRSDPESLNLGEHNGTYLVMRQLHQNVNGFWQYMDEQTRNESGPNEENRERLASKVVGRWPDGSPLTPTNEKSPVSTDQRTGANDLFYAADDPNGFGCPLGSHIRRANPRDTLDLDPLDPVAKTNHDRKQSHEFTKRHRILRRGRNYGVFLENPLTATQEEKEQDRGLVFVCLNTDIGRQFEFIQHTWLNSTKFNGLYDESDPLLGPLSRDGKKKSFTIQKQPVRCRVHGMERFVTVKGGAYFFLPGIASLRLLSEI